MQWWCNIQAIIVDSFNSSFSFHNEFCLDQLGENPNNKDNERNKENVKEKESATEKYLTGNNQNTHFESSLGKIKKKKTL